MTAIVQRQNFKRRTGSTIAVWRGAGGGLTWRYPVLRTSHCRLCIILVKWFNCSILLA